MALIEKSDPFRTSDCSESAPSWMRSDAVQEVTEESASLALHRCKATSQLEGESSKQLNEKAEPGDAAAEGTEETASESRKSFQASGLSEGEGSKESSTILNALDNRAPVKKQANSLNSHEGDLPDKYQDVTSVLAKCKKSRMRLHRMSVMRQDGNRLSKDTDDDITSTKFFTDYVDKEPGPFLLVLHMTTADEATKGPKRSASAGNGDAPAAKKEKVEG